ncbi:helix-turn-helix domain-containing protein [Nonomuraea sp. MG754425]|uniref:helix-turn-helix domain-containing protein n=1 Tax=Nonomuraea sp. MG754425 TaxID=2570319 RepID=UPI001F2EDE8A|nr:helix-turn-helix transcriptional regulator [Nonomuraea sp. MG754425]MCF6475150.1 helix-turn-helix domain-containing protein [Nonomuraea sp. MG754425]
MSDRDDPVSEPGHGHQPEAMEDPAAAFIAQLRALHQQQGSPSVRELADRTRRAHAPYSKSVIGQALQGHRLPSEGVLRALVQALGVDDPQPWLERRAQALAAGRTTPAAPREDPVEHTIGQGDGADEQPAAAGQSSVLSHEADRGHRLLPRKTFPRWLIMMAVVPMVAILLTAGMSALGGMDTGIGPRPTGTPPSPAAPAAALTQATSPATTSVPSPSLATPVGKEAGTWSAVHGLGCEAEWAYADPGWRPAGGGWRKDGCTGTALFLQVTSELGHATQLVNWYFDTRPEARCTIEAFIADDHRSAGTAYYYLDDDDTTAPHLAGPVTVDQNAHRGTWTTLGTWPVPGPGRLTLILANQPHRAHDTHTVTASAARATCQ